MKPSVFWSEFRKKIIITMMSIAIPLGIVLFVVLLEFISKNVK